MSKAWYVVQTLPCAEGKASRHLSNQGFSVYLPRYRRRVRHARRSLDVLRPLFPGYLFVCLDPAACRWRSINGTIGVCRILSDGDLPTCVDFRVIEEIKAREDESGIVELLPPVFARGQAVRVIDGPLADLDGIFEETKDNKRVTLLISLLGRKVRMQMPAISVVAA